jgi:hypothetical protein
MKKNIEINDEPTGAPMMPKQTKNRRDSEQTKNQREAKQTKNRRDANQKKGGRRKIPLSWTCNGCNRTLFF